MKKTAVVFSHAHWDVEWYMPYRSFRFWLTDLVDSLLSVAEKDPRFHTFVMDGQVAPIDHYLTVNPQNEQRVRRLIEDGKLTIGPFYTQYDEWLISGEAIVRNTLHGLLRGEELGRTMKVGYLPDNFGHPLQMPQILRGFGLDGLIFMRGMPDKPEGMGDEFYIRGLDGTCVLGIHLQRGYGNALNMWALRGDPMTIRTTPYADMFSGYESHRERASKLDVDAAAKEMIRSAEDAAQRHPSGVLPLAAGSDHCPPIGQIAEIIEHANRLQDDIEFVQGDCEDIVKAIRESRIDLAVYDKELWGSRYQYLLTGTLTTRSYIKQANFAAENLLTQYAEPIASIASIYGREYAAVLLKEAWDCMYLNQAHDSIHGSSVDAVHQEMMQRYDNVKQICAGVIHDALKYLGTVSDGWYRKHRYGILTYSPAHTGSDCAVADAWVHTGDDPFCLRDRDGNSIPMQVLDNPFAADQRGGSGIPPWPDARARHILFEVPRGANAIHSVAVVESPVERSQVSTCCSDTSGTDEVIENDYIRVEFVNGALVVTDKVYGRSYAGLGVIEDEADDGDAWDFSRTWSKTRVYRSDQYPSRCRLVENGPVRSSLLMETTMRVPRCLENGRRSRRKVEIPMAMRVSLYRRSRRVEVALELDNQAKDHRMRLKCPTGVRCESVKSQGHFGIIERPLRSPHGGESWRQPPADTYHFRDWVAVDDGESGIAIACKGLCEYEATDQGEAGTTLYVTLLRGIDRMSKVGMRSRKGEASPSVPIPGAQCLGIQRFEVAFIPYGVDTDGDRFPFIGSTNAFLYPPVAHLVREDHRPTTEDIEERMFELSPANLVVSAFKLAEDAGAYILRFWENEGRETKCRLRLSDRFSHVYLTDLKEEAIREVEVKNGVVSLEVGAFKIVTLKLVSQRSGSKVIAR